MDHEIDQIAESIQEDPDIVDTSLMRSLKHIRENEADYREEDIEDAPLSVKAQRVVAGGGALMRTGRAGRKELRDTLKNIRGSEFRKEQEMERLRQLRDRQTKGRIAMVFPRYYRKKKGRDGKYRGWEEVSSGALSDDGTNLTDPREQKRLRKIVFQNIASEKLEAYQTVYEINLLSKNIEELEEALFTLKKLESMIRSWRSGERIPKDGPHIVLGADPDSRWGLRSEFVHDMLQIVRKGSPFRDNLRKRIAAVKRRQDEQSIQSAGI